MQKAKRSVKCVLDFLIRPRPSRQSGPDAHQRRRQTEETDGRVLRRVRRTKSDEASPTETPRSRGNGKWRRHTQEGAVEQSVAADGAGASDHAPLLNCSTDQSVWNQSRELGQLPELRPDSFLGTEVGAFLLDRGHVKVLAFGQPLTRVDIPAHARIVERDFCASLL